MMLAYGYVCSWSYAINKWLLSLHMSFCDMCLVVFNATNLCSGARDIALIYVINDTQNIFSTISHKLHNSRSFNISSNRLIVG